MNNRVWEDKCKCLSECVCVRERGAWGAGALVSGCALLKRFHSLNETNLARLWNAWNGLTRVKCQIYPYDF